MRHAVEVAPIENLRHAVDVAADHVAAELVADLSERSRLALSPTFQPPSVVTASVSAPTSVAIAVRLPRRAASTTVRHTPAWATDAPTSTVATS